MSKRSLVDSIEVKKTCSENWDAMTGSERVRFCSHCSLEVNNLSALTRKQAMRLVSRSDGRICVRYVVNPVDSAPFFAGSKLYQITRRAGIAAGVLSATLSLSALGLAQTAPDLSNTKTEILRSEAARKNETESPTTSVSGTITDPNDAVVPEAPVMLINLKTNASLTTKTNGEGVYKFENVGVGRYKVSALAERGFGLTEKEIEVSGQTETVADLRVEPNQSFIMGEMVVVAYRTPLFTAVSNDEREVARNLIAKGENVNRRDENYSNITPLFLAVENGNAEIAEMLLNFGAKINARDDNRQTPLMRLDEDATAELVNLLLKHGARINLTDKEGNTVLILAARNVKTDVLQILLRRAANIDAQNAAGRTALMEAADADNLENVRALLAAGADPNLKDKENETALDLTTDEEIEKLLVSYGAQNADDSQ